MTTHDNTAIATIIPASATRVSFTDPAERAKEKGKGANATENKDKKLDGRLENYRPTIESQPKPLQATLCETILAMLLSTQRVASKKAGILSLRKNQDLHPNSINCKEVMADVPDAVAAHATTKEHIEQHQKTLSDAKAALKAIIIKQGDFVHDAMDTELTQWKSGSQMRRSRHNLGHCVEWHTGPLQPHRMCNSCCSEKGS